MLPVDDTAVAAAGQDRPELQKAIQEIVDSGFAAVQLRVHDERGEWVGSAGVRKLGEAAKPLTNGRFRIGSNTKTFTATLVLQLVADGKIGLDDPAEQTQPVEDPVGDEVGRVGACSAVACVAVTFTDEAGIAAPNARGKAEPLPRRPRVNEPSPGNRRTTGSTPSAGPVPTPTTSIQNNAGALARAEPRRVDAGLVAGHAGDDEADVVDDAVAEVARCPARRRRR
ncbi:serine hydrolase [Micromonospora sp. NPDC005161]